jgi:hypothetical protein
VRTGTAENEYDQHYHNHIEKEGQHYHVRLEPALMAGSLPPEKLHENRLESVEERFPSGSVVKVQQNREKRRVTVCG